MRPKSAVHKYNRTAGHAVYSRVGNGGVDLDGYCNTMIHTTPEWQRGQGPNTPGACHVPGLPEERCRP
eukprot:2817444-Prymnesium_polylepis.1